MRGIMVQGTCSDAGKSYVTTALCRILANRGYKVAPFKSQNMSNNSYVTENGKEIGRAQGVQAEAAKTKATVHMNPILLKPMMDTKSEVVLHGEVFRQYSGFQYNKEFTMNKGIEAIKYSLGELEKEYDLVVIEGAGSPAEVNLNHREIVNMRVAELADVDVILVADIDRGGSFASVVGTLELVFQHRHRIKGILLNKFRGDIRLLQDGLDWLEDYTGVKVIGVIPYMDDIYVETEDAQSVHLLYNHTVENPIDIAVIHMDRVSNNTDLEPFIHEEDVSVRIVKDVKSFGNPHAIIIPGTKSTIEDLEKLYDCGLANKIKDYCNKGGVVFGICGGYQVLGRKIIDPLGVDTNKNKSIDGLNILPIETVFKEKKTVRKIGGEVQNPFIPHQIEGYEIHLGESNYLGDVNPLVKLEDGTLDGCMLYEGRVMGTYLHNIFHNDIFRNHWLNMLREKYNLWPLEAVDTTKIKEQSYNRLAEIFEKNIDMDYITNIIFKNNK